MGLGAATPPGTFMPPKNIRISSADLSARSRIASAGFAKSNQSGIRESNSFHSLGKAGHDRYTNPANDRKRTYRL